MDLNPGHQLNRLAESIGLDLFTVKTVFCLFATFPLSAVLKRLPDSRTDLKCYYVIAVSLFYIFAIMNITDGFITLMVSSMGTYVITRYIHTPYMPWINFIFLMAHLTVNHLKLQFFITEDYDPDTVDITRTQMVLVMKMTLFAWSIHDGRYPGKDEPQKSKALKTHPAILPFLGYAFFFPLLMIGPLFDYADFDKWLHGTLFKDVPLDKRPGKRKRMIPKNGKLVLWKVVQGIIWGVLFFKMGLFFEPSDLFKLTFMDKPFIVRAFLLYYLGLVARFRFYAAWTISEAGCNLCGLGYNGYDPKIGFKWNAVQNIDPWKFETGQNAHVCLEAWNMNTNKWLKNYVYLRVKRPDRKPGFKSTMFTFFVSAFWHGTRPGYYVCFMCGALFQTCMRIYRRNFRPIFASRGGKAKLAYDIVCWMVTQFSFGFLVMPFILLDFEKLIYAFSTVYYYPLVGVALTFLVFKGPKAAQVSAYLKQFVVAEEEEKPKVKDPRLQKILKDKEEFEYNSLGVPNMDLTQKEFEEASKEVSQMADEIKNWNDTRRLSISEGKEVVREALEEIRKDMIGKSD